MSQKGDQETTHDVLNLSNIYQKIILMCFKGVEHLFAMYVDIHIICQVLVAIKLMDATALLMPNSSLGSVDLYNVFACGINVYLNVYTDKDITMCAVAVHTKTV